MFRVKLPGHHEFFHKPAKLATICPILYYSGPGQEAGLACVQAVRAGSTPAAGPATSAIGGRFVTADLADSLGGALGSLLFCCVSGRDGFTLGTDWIKARHG